MAHSPPNKPFIQAADPSELAPGTLIDGRYRVVRVIGVGGTGIVYEVEHDRTGQRLALKTLLDPAQAPRLEQEARALAKLRSAHVVKVVELGHCDAGPFMVMTLLVGRNLRDVLESKVRLPLSFVSNLAVQVAEGLDEAHRVGLVHRDLKPDNMHLADPADADTEVTGPEGKPPHDLTFVTVFDFGVVKMSAAELNNPLTRTGSTVGTPYYMSLEQLRGAGTVDAQSDVYALCVVLYECLAGQRPFEAGTLGDLIFAICSINPAPLRTLRPDIPADVADVVMRGLSREKKDRPQAMRDLARVFAPHADPSFTFWLRVGESAAKPVETKPTAPSTPRPAEVIAPAQAPAVASSSSATAEAPARPAAAAPTAPTPPSPPVSPSAATSGAAATATPPTEVEEVGAKPPAPSTGKPPEANKVTSAAAPLPGLARPRPAGLQKPVPPPRPTTKLGASDVQAALAEKSGPPRPATSKPASVAPPAAASLTTKMAALTKPEVLKVEALPKLGAPPKIEVPLARPASDPTTAGEILDEGSTHNDRETPTEMFVQGVHGEPEIEDEPSGLPTGEMARVGGTTPPPTGPNGSIPTMSLPADLALPRAISNEDKTAILDIAALQRNPPNPSPRYDAAPPSSASMAGPTSSAIAPAPTFGMPASHGPQGLAPASRQSFPQMGQLGGPPLSPMAPPSQGGARVSPMQELGPPSGVAAAPFFAAGAGGPSPLPSAARPGWEVALTNAGERVNALAFKGLARFRRASQEQQIVVVMVGTASLAVLAVLVIWALWLA